MDGKFERGTGVLCHISSLPGKYGIGSLGDEAYDFVRLLNRAHVKYWQVLPLAHTGYGDSPYQSVCCFSGNPYFIDLKALKEKGLLDDEELQSAETPSGDIDFAALYEDRINLLRLAYARFNIKDKNFTAFVEKGEFEDYAVFMSLKTRYGGTFDTFPEAYKFKERLAMLEFKHSVNKSDYLFWQFVQFVFDVQWKQLKDYANSLGVKIIGEIPFYAAYDSSDVWGRPKLFKLDSSLKPVLVAGAPSDGEIQNTGIPVYDWEAMSADNYEWWLKRIEKASKQFDIVKIDHFQWFDKYYAVPADKSAEEGEWLPAPGIRLFSEIKRRLGDVEIIAEDSDTLDGGVHRLLDRTGFPAIKVLQSCFNGDRENLASEIEEDCVVYTATHDTDTTLGYLNSLTDDEFTLFKKRLRKALADENAVCPFVTREQAALGVNVCALASNARIAVLPVQDVMGLDSGARMNVPSTAEGNWKFRLETFPSRRDFAVLRKMTDQYKR